jgi:hypothetical protein
LPKYQNLTLALHTPLQINLSNKVVEDKVEDSKGGFVRLVYKDITQITFQCMKLASIKEKTRMASSPNKHKLYTAI